MGGGECHNIKMFISKLFLKLSMKSVWSQPWTKHKWNENLEVKSNFAKKELHEVNQSGNGLLQNFFNFDNDGFIEFILLSSFVYAWVSITEKNV